MCEVLEELQERFAHGLSDMYIVLCVHTHAGYGDTVMLTTADHIDVCKPLSREDPAYSTLAAMLEQVLQRVAPQHPAALSEDPLADMPEH
jgi:hypothetical protein